MIRKVPESLKVTFSYKFTMFLYHLYIIQNKTKYMLSVAVQRGNCASVRGGMNY